jgi:hypothetical protein
MTEPELAELEARQVALVLQIGKLQDELSALTLRISDEHERRRELATVHELRPGLAVEDS